MKNQNMKGPGGPGPKGTGTPEQPGKLLGRLARYIVKSYKVHIVIVIICIFISVLANVQGTMFMKNLIDLYIMPLIGQSSPDFGPLLGAILKVAVFYMIGVLATFSYNRIMVYVTQGTLKNLRNDMFHHMESLPIKYFDTHAHGDIMSIYTNDIDTLRQMISQSIPQIINTVITMIATLITMLVLNPVLTIIPVVTAIIMLLVTSKLAGRSAGRFSCQTVEHRHNHSPGGGVVGGKGGAVCAAHQVVLINILHRVAGPVPLGHVGEGMLSRRQGRAGEKRQGQAEGQGRAYHSFSHTA